MRVPAAATVVLLSSCLLSAGAWAQQADSMPGTSQTQAVPVQPERTPQQSDQARERERQRAEDTRVNRDWTAQQRDDDRMGMDRMDMDRMRQHRMGRMMDQDMDHRTTGRNARMQRDDDDMDRRARSSEGDRPYRRVKICYEYENGDELCRYRD
ncbi:MULTISPECIES: hypothetical protein [unclassified Bradyrhizobium]|uniref:hypothetical protein n=1 Tax=Bradyrhizobium TaxID=374 RepID=UPI002916A079|nr:MULTISPECIES: hypothetical protein [unclassified Bradyrhizobium]